MNKKELAAVETLEELKIIADANGMSYSSRIGIDTLRTKLLAHFKTERRLAKVNNEKVKRAQITAQGEEEKAGKKKSKKKTKKKTKFTMDKGLVKSEKTKIALKKQEKKRRKAKAKAKKFIKNVSKAETSLARSGSLFTHINESPAERVMRVRRSAIRKQRVKITVYDPNRAELPSEVIRGRNKYSGGIGQVVMYDNKPQYLPVIIINILKERQYFKTVSEKQPDGSSRNTKKAIPAYFIEYMDDLTEDELSELAAKQERAGIIAQEA